MKELDTIREAFDKWWFESLMMSNRPVGYDFAWTIWQASALAALSTIDPEAIRRETIDELCCAARETLKATDRVAFAWKVGKCGPLSPTSCYVPDIARALDRLRAAILGAEPARDMPKCTRPEDTECHAHSGDKCYNHFQCKPAREEL